MPIAKKSRLAVAALLELARHSQPYPLPQLSRRLRVSVSYLELVFGGLRRNGLVLSTRGPGGGYRLARSLAVIGVLDVVATIDELDPNSSRQEEAGQRPADSHATGRIDSSWWEASGRAMAGCLPTSRCTTSSRPTDAPDWLQQRPSERKML
jgi:Rrf2 family iron-sulfur cluster assembly transcriptional regulator